MRILLASILTSAALAAQNFVTNGDFETGVLTPWVAGGTAYNPQIEIADVTGLGATQSYGCGAGGAVYAPPHAPNWIEQSVLFIPGIPYELGADVCASGMGGNVHAGALYVEVAGVEVGRLDFLSFTANKVERGRLTCRFTTTAAGMAPLRVNFIRPQFIYNNGTPRMNADNITLQIAIGPTLSIQGNRQMGTSVPFTVDGGSVAGGAPFATFLAAGVLNPPVQIPTIVGLLYLDPLSLALLNSGTLDTSGKSTLSISVPVNPALTTAATYFQSFMILGTTGYLGFHQGATFVN